MHVWVLSWLLRGSFKELWDLKVIVRFLASTTGVLLFSSYLEIIRRKNKLRPKLVIEADNLGNQVFWYAHRVM